MAARSGADLCTETLMSQVIGDARELLWRELGERDHVAKIDQADLAIASVAMLRDGITAHAPLHGELLLLA